MPINTVIHPNIAIKNLTNHAGSLPNPNPGRSCIANAISISGTGARYALRPRRACASERCASWSYSSVSENAPGTCSCSAGVVGREEGRETAIGGVA